MKFIKKLSVMGGILAYSMNMPSFAVDTKDNTPPPANYFSASPLIKDSKLNFLFRNYSDYLEVDGSGIRHAWIQSMRADFQSGFTDGAIGFGVDAALFAALKLDGGQGAGSMVHLDRNGGSQNRLFWAYPGTYALKLRGEGWVLKHGLHIISNPFLEPFDIRSLPPSFRGTTLTSTNLPDVSLELGHINAVNARGHTHLQDLSTSYGRVKVDRFIYAGANWNYLSNGKLSLYVNQASDVWNQSYAAISHSIGEPSEVKVTMKGNIYYTRNQGASRQGDISNTGYSAGVSLERGASTLGLSYQRIIGDQFLDFLRESSGIYLANSYGSDYNAPHEQSLQLRYALNAKTLGIPGLQVAVWGIYGWGADATAEANKHASPQDPLHGVYWISGQVLRGSHREIGLNPTYVVQSGTFKDSKLSLLILDHKRASSYSDANFREYRININMPFNAF